MIFEGSLLAVLLGGGKMKASHPVDFRVVFLSPFVVTSFVTLWMHFFFLRQKYECQFPLPT